MLRIHAYKMLRLKELMIDRLERIEIDSEVALWDWLSMHHNRQDSYLLVTWKKADKDRYVSRDQVLDALLAYGWIDGRRYALDEAKTMQLICQRQQQKWTKTYRDRIDRLQARGLLKPAGLAAVNAAKANGTWMALQDVDNLEEPPELLEVLRSQKGFDWWSNSAPSYRRNALRWLASAKKDETRQKRCQQIAIACVAGQKIKNL